MGVGLTPTEKKFLAAPAQFNSSYRSKLYYRISKKVLASVELLLDARLEIPVDPDVVEKVVGLILDNDSARFALFNTIQSRLSSRTAL
ncbi:unnamed protein product [marine sediment metagenome]|uniref:Uncharacterized protein n=1 Tax=marine sediment metagenome TaxID=412755 RepID=X1P851_9ZZZZ